MAEYVQPDISLIGDEHVKVYRETNGEQGYIWNGDQANDVSHCYLPGSSCRLTGRDSGANARSTGR